MRGSRVVLSFTCLTIVALAGLPAPAEAQVSILRLRALNESGVREGPCFVIRQEKQAESTFLVLVTSARLSARESEREAGVYVDDEPAVDTGANAISALAGTEDITHRKAVVAARPMSVAVFVVVSECEGEPVPDMTPALFWNPGGRSMTTDTTRTYLMEDPERQLERALIDEFLRERGLDWSALDRLPQAEANGVLAEASRYAGTRLAEIESRAHFVHEIHSER